MAEQVPRGTRRFVAIFLVAFLASGLFGVEAWPLTGWRLFSHLRRSHQVSWQALAVDADGRRRPVAFAHLPWAYRGFSLLMQRFDGMAPGRQRAVCWSWLDALRQATRGRVVAVRLFRLDRELTFSRTAPPRMPRRTLLFACGVSDEHGAV